MTPSQKAKAAGLKSLLQVSELTGVSIQTLSNWAKNKPKLFAIVLKGAWMQWFKEDSERLLIKPIN